MGYGDELMATGMARGAKARGKRIAFGDGQKINWSPNNSELIFRGNPNIAPPGSEGEPDIEWVPFYKGHRIYNRQDGNRWVWNYDFRPTPGEVFFSDEERRFADSVAQAYPGGFVLVEPNVPWHKGAAVNKDWGVGKYQNVVNALRAEGHTVVQFSHGRTRLTRAKPIATPTFRHALAALSVAKLAIVPEGGLHHGAAAVGVRAVVIFGGFIPPQVTGYDSHINLAAGGEACGMFVPCNHCRAALHSIRVSEVVTAADKILAEG